ncbi:tetratricopeptide repeat protein [Candidatus Amoebophilus asiaticus]|nr:tetratricopeptide repeat protein [Candidatus Amoebophilus asiaticus]
MMMRKTLSAFMIICSIAAFGQTSKEHLQNGISKHEKQNFKGAIKDYSKAIKADKKNKDAYYNRGTCELALKDFKSALTDFDKTLKLDPSFVKAYYSRATVFVSQQKYTQALPDLDKTIELDPTIPNVLTLRGQIRAQSGDKKGACEDFIQAKKNGDKQADKYLSRFCGTEQQGGESLMLEWPKNENWKVGDDQENSEQRVLDLIHTNETIDNWTELGNMTTMKGITGVPMDKAMNLMFDQTKQNAPKAKLTFIEKEENTEYPWIIFTIESPGFKNDKIPESQLWYIVQGKQALYTNFIAIKKASIPADLKDKWTKFFKTGKILYN